MGGFNTASPAAGASADAALNRAKLLPAVQDSGSLQAALDAAPALTPLLITDDEVVAVPPLNTHGADLHGPGRVLQAVVGGQRQLNTYADRAQHVFGREYLSAFHKRLMAGANAVAVLTGDSTTEGTGVGPAYVLDALLHAMFVTVGVGGGVAWHNRGQGGKSSLDWQDTYLAGDLALNPDLLVVRWGTNDPYTEVVAPNYGRDAPTFLATMRECLATVRATRTLAQCSVVLMAPNSTSNTPGAQDARWLEDVVPGLRAIAREYQCCFLDTYALWQDSVNAGDWMDTLVDGVSHVHPADVFNAWIASALFELLCPLQMRIGGGIRNVTGVTTLPSAAAPPSSYTASAQLNRASGDWPLDGAALTFRALDGVWLQMNWPYLNSVAQAQWRLSLDNTGAGWTPWTQLGAADPALFTPTLAGLGGAGAQTYATRQGRHYVEGRRVHFVATITLSALDAATGGPVVVSGLPYPNGDAYYGQIQATAWGGITLPAGYSHIGGLIAPGASQILLNLAGSGVPRALLDAGALSGTTDLWLEGSYYKG